SWTRPDKVVRDQFSSTHDAQLVMEIIRWDLARTADGIKIENPLVDDEVLSRSNYVNVGGKYTQADSHRGRHAYIGCALTLVGKSDDNGAMQVKFDLGPVSYTPPASTNKSWSTRWKIVKFNDFRLPEPPKPVPKPDPIRLPDDMLV